MNEFSVEKGGYRKTTHFSGRPTIMTMSVSALRLRKMTHLDSIDLKIFPEFTIAKFLQSGPSDIQHLGGNAFCVSVASIIGLRDDDFQIKEDLSRQNLPPPTVWYVQLHEVVY